MLKKILIFTLILCINFLTHANNEKQTILIMGGAGYIGSSVSLYIMQKDFQVIILDKQNLKPGLEVYANSGKIKFIKSDFSDEAVLNRIFKEYKINTVLHFAAFIEVSESVSNPQKYYENNVVKTIKLLDIMRNNGVNNFIFSSSCAVYGPPNFLPITESHSYNPISPYGNTKRIVEMVLQDYAQSYGLNCVALRYFNAAGGWPEFNLGELHEPETHIIPILLKAALSNKPFTVFGNDYETFDGTSIRDYLHIRDLASAHHLAVNYVNKNKGFTAINLGSENGVSIKQMIQAVEKVTQTKVQINFANRRAGDPAILIADSKKAKSLLGWQPIHSSLENIIKTALDFYTIQTRTQATR